VSLRDRLDDDLKTALRSKDEIGKDTLRMIKAEIKNKEVQKGSVATLDDDGIIQIIATGVKKRKESARLFEEGGRQELADKENAEIKFLSVYLPQQLSEDDVKKAVEEVIKEIGATEPKQMGQVMKTAMAKLGKSCDGSLVSRFAKELLSR